MLEVGGVLKTWALSGPPDGSPVVAAEMLADHRLQYLDYEGPISGDRGHVTRWDAGQYELETQTPDRWVVILSGQRLQGRVVLSRQGGQTGWECVMLNA